MVCSYRYLARCIFVYILGKQYPIYLNMTSTPRFASSVLARTANAIGSGSINLPLIRHSSGREVPPKFSSGGGAGKGSSDARGQQFAACIALASMLLACHLLLVTQRTVSKQQALPVHETSTVDTIRGVGYLTGCTKKVGRPRCACAWRHMLPVPYSCQWAMVHCSQTTPSPPHTCFLQESNAVVTVSKCKDSFTLLPHMLTLTGKRHAGLLHASPLRTAHALLPSDRNARLLTAFGVDPSMTAGMALTTDPMQLLSSPSPRLVGIGGTLLVAEAQFYAHATVLTEVMAVVAPHCSSAQVLPLIANWADSQSLAFLPHLQHEVYSSLQHMVQTCNGTAPPDNVMYSIAKLWAGPQSMLEDIKCVFKLWAHANSTSGGGIKRAAGLSAAETLVQRIARISKVQQTSVLRAVHLLAVSQGKLQPGGEFPEDVAAALEEASLQQVEVCTPCITHAMRNGGRPMPLPVGGPAE